MMFPRKSGILPTESGPFLRSWQPHPAFSSILAGLFSVTLLLSSSAWCFQPPAGGATEKKETLIESQEAIQLRYRKFAQVLQEMTEYLRQTEPDRAALLGQVSSRSNESQISDRMNQLRELLEKGKLGEAIEREEELVAALQAILDLMNSEDRAKELEEEKAKLEAYLKDVNRLIGGQRDVRAGTEKGKTGSELAPQQKQLEEQTAKLRERIEQDQRKKKSGSKPSQDSPKTPAPSGEPTKGPENSGEESGNSPSKPEEKSEHPGSEELKQAHHKMQDASGKLKQNQSRNASEDQDQALLELEKARQKLEEILRQLREEERDRTLAGMEERLQRLLTGEVAIHTETIQLGEIPEMQRTSRHRNRAVQMSRQQKELGLEAEKLLRLLREEGSAVAFPEVVTQIRDDMQLVADRLGKMEVGELTRNIEADIISSLKEMILALQKEMEENRQKKMKGSQQQQGEPQDPQLVQQIAELKMLRSLQVRINKRTQQYARLVNGDQAEEREVIDQLHKLSQAQSRIQRATYDLATQKNE